MPRSSGSDSDLNRSGDGRIILTMRDDCPECGTEVEVYFLTDAYDEDGLADVEPGSITADVDCPNPEPFPHGWQSVYDGWLMFGEAG